MFKKILTIGVYLLGLGLMILSLAFSSQCLSRVKCNGLTVIIPEESSRFIDEAEITRLVKAADPHLFEKKLDAVNTNALEKKLQKTPAIKNAEVFRHISGDRMDFKGHLVVEVTQRQPLFRIRNKKSDRYMDAEGVFIPANPKFTAHVILISGQPSEELARKQLIPLVRFIDRDEFWKAQIKQIDVSPSGELTMVPLVGDQLIEFGDPSNYREKFRNLKALYEQAFSKLGWDKYSKISLKYKGQVVCTRRQ